MRKKNKHKPTHKNHQISIYEALQTCAWCQKKLDHQEECYEMGAKTVKGYDLSKKAGTCIHIALVGSQRIVPAIVPVPGSEAARKSDIGFVLCSMECGVELKRALSRESEIIDTFNN